MKDLTSNLPTGPTFRPLWRVLAIMRRVDAG